MDSYSRACPDLPVRVGWIPPDIADHELPVRTARAIDETGTTHAASGQPAVLIETRQRHHMIDWSLYQSTEPGVAEPTEVLASAPGERREPRALHSRRVRAAALAFLLLLFSPSALPVGLPVSSENQAPMAAESYFAEIELVSHDGRTWRLYQDLMKNKTVVFSAFFSRCQAVCPPLNAKLMELQRALGPRVGKDVLFVSITVDPEFDTPARLSEMATKLHARPGWLLMSGSPEQVHTALLRLGYATPEKEAHSPLLVIAREQTGVWKKAHGFAPMDDLLQIVRAVIDEAP